MASAHVAAFRASLGRCLVTQDFLHRFYGLFVAPDRLVSMRIHGEEPE